MAAILFVIQWGIKKEIKNKARHSTEEDKIRCLKNSISERRQEKREKKSLHDGSHSLAGCIYNIFHTLHHI